MDQVHAKGLGPQSFLQVDNRVRNGLEGQACGTEDTEESALSSRYNEID